MSLNAYYDKIENYKEVCYRTNAETGEQEYEPVLQTLVFYSMVVDLGEITEKNIEEWSFRLWLYQRLNGPLMRAKVTDDDGNESMIEYDLTEEMIRPYIGLRVNVLSTSRAKWKTRFFKMADQDFNSKWRRVRLPPKEDDECESSQ